MTIERIIQHYRDVPKVELLEYPYEYKVAQAYVWELHKSQKRKDGITVYPEHLFDVGELLLRYGGTVIEATAGLLHDAIEDQKKNRGKPSDPWNTVYQSLDSHLIYGLPRGLVVPGQTISPNEKNVFTFIRSGGVNMVNVSYAAIEVTPKRATTDLERVKKRENKLLTISELRNIFLHSGNVGIDLAHKDIDLFRSEILEIANINPRAFFDAEVRVQFTFKPEAFRLMDTKSDSPIGILIRDKAMKEITEDDARANIYRFHSGAQANTRPEPRIVYLCPADAKRADGKPRSIHYLHHTEATVLNWLNEYIEKKKHVDS